MAVGPRVYFFNHIFMEYMACDLHEKFCLEAEHIRNLSKRTIVWYKHTFKYFNNSFSILYITDITTEKIKEYLFNWKIQKNWSTSTFINYKKWLNSFLTWCVENNFLKENPVLWIPKPKMENRIPKSLKKWDAIKILEYSFHIKYQYRFEKYRNRVIIWIMLFAWLRKSELLNLMVNDIDFDNNTIFIRQWKWKKDRLIPLNSDLKVYIKEYLKDRNRLNKDSVYLLNTLKWNSRLNDSWFTKIIKKIKEKTSIDFSAHKLRHTFATLMLEWWVDLFTLSKMLWHSDIKTTTIYLTANIHHMQEQIVKHPLSWFK